VSPRRVVALIVALAALAGVLSARPSSAAVAEWRWAGGHVYLASTADPTYWRADAARREWNSAPDLRFGTENRRCDDPWQDRQCVQVRERRIGAATNLATARVTHYQDDAGHTRVAYCVVIVNRNARSRPAAVRYSALLHEVGHCNGLAHTGRTDSVMTTSPSSFPTDLTAYDRAEVDRRYPW